MASLTVTVGPITATRSAGNATVAALVDDYIAAYDGPTGMTAQQKADWLVNDLARHIREVANGRAIRASIATAEATATATVSTRDWS